jgi:hypothetical protein
MDQEREADWPPAPAQVISARAISPVSTAVSTPKRKPGYP